MILDIYTMREIKPLAENIDYSRLTPYLKEVEELEFMQVLGANACEQLELFTEDPNNKEWTNEHGEIIVLNREQKDVLYMGGYYDSVCGRNFCPGILQAGAYLAYSRFVVNNNINVVAYGVVSKRSEFSDPISDELLIRSSRDNFKKGKLHLMAVYNYMESLNLVGHKRSKLKNRNRFKCIRYDGRN